MQATRNREVGLLATQATVSSRPLRDLVGLARRRAAARDACPGSCRFESDDPFGAETADAVRSTPRRSEGQVSTPSSSGARYPMIKPILQRVFGRDVTLVFSADETTRGRRDARAQGNRERPVARGQLPVRDDGRAGNLPQRVHAFCSSRSRPWSTSSSPSSREWRRERKPPTRRAAADHGRGRLPRAAARGCPLLAGGDEVLCTATIEEEVRGG